MIINISNLSAAYPGNDRVLDQLDLQLDPGRISALAAPNGEGKTTLFKCLTGLRFPTKGKIEVFGLQPKNRSPDLLNKLYFLPAEPSLPDWSPLKIGQRYGPFYPNFNQEIYGQCLQDFRVDPAKAIGKLSFGQQRRVQLAFALAVRTPLLLLDEPTLGLDIAGKDQFRRSLIQCTEEGQTVIIATHQLGEVASVLDDLIILKDKKIHSQFDIGQAYESLSFNLSSRAPQPLDGTYGRRVPGGWLTVDPNGSRGNAQPDLETLYLAITEGEISLGKPVKTVGHV
jgi:ABC-2 type transport system ATP-binding protein